MSANSTMMAEANAIERWVHDLQEYLDAADFDAAVEYVLHLPADELSRQMALLKQESLHGLRVRCVFSEIYDYAGMFSDAARIIRPVGLKAQRDITMALKRWSNTVAPHECELEYLAQQCWACLHLAMVEYRRQDYETAQQLSRLAAEMLEKINVQVPCFSALSRAYYCLGLVERESHRYDTARQYFSISVEHSWRRIENNPLHAVAYAEYNIARALGLGMAWLAYARASMFEANAHILSARLLLRKKDVRYIRAYIDIVHSCTQRSRAATLPTALQAVQGLEVALAQLGGKDVLHDPARGHVIYAGRAIAELAMAHLSAARLCALPSNQADKQKHLKSALEYARLIRSSSMKAGESLPQFFIRDKRTYCNALIIESRVFRELRQYKKALACAVKAYRIGREEPFSRIDCWLALGDAYYHDGNYAEARKYFQKAREDEHAQTNPKVVAVCDLQLARCHLKLNEIDQAKELVRIWKTSGCPGGDNAFVRNLAHEMDQNLAQLQVQFVIPAKPPTLNAKVWLTEIRYWLATTAMKEANNDKKAAMRLLGLKSLRQLNKWLNPERPEIH